MTGSHAGICADIGYCWGLCTHPFRVLRFRLVIHMGIWTAIKTAILGVRLLSTEDVKNMADSIILYVDKDKDGYISVYEFIEMVKAWTKTN